MVKRAPHLIQLPPPPSAPFSNLIVKSGHFLQNSCIGSGGKKEIITSKVLITSVKLTDTKSNVTLATADFGTATLSERYLRGITFIAETEGYTSSLGLYIDHRYVRTERRPPYSCFSDRHGDFKPWPIPILNKWVSLVVQAYSPDNFVNPQNFWFRQFREE